MQRLWDVWEWEWECVTEKLQMVLKKKHKQHDNSTLPTSCNMKGTWWREWDINATSCSLTVCGCLVTKSGTEFSPPGFSASKSLFLSPSSTITLHSRCYFVPFIYNAFLFTISWFCDPTCPSSTTSPPHSSASSPYLYFHLACFLHLPLFFLKFVPLFLTLFKKLFLSLSIICLYVPFFILFLPYSPSLLHSLNEIFLFFYPHHYLAIPLVSSLNENEQSIIYPHLLSNMWMMPFQDDRV